MLLDLLVGLGALLGALLQFAALHGLEVRQLLLALLLRVRQRRLELEPVHLEHVARTVVLSTPLLHCLLLVLPYPLELLLIVQLQVLQHLFALLTSMLRVPVEARYFVLLLPHAPPVLLVKVVQPVIGLLRHLLLLRIVELQRRAELALDEVEPLGGALRFARPIALQRFDLLVHRRPLLQQRELRIRLQLLHALLKLADRPQCLLQELLRDEDVLVQGGASGRDGDGRGHLLLELDHAHAHPFLALRRRPGFWLGALVVEHVIDNGANGRRRAG